MFSYFSNFYLPVDFALVSKVKCLTIAEIELQLLSLAMLVLK